MTSIGIHGVGTYLPPHVRTNDWWSPEIVAGWRDRAATKAMRSDVPAGTDLSEGARKTLAAMAEYSNDPFRGAIERHVMSDDSSVPEMEAFAARDAMQRAGVGPAEIDIILTQTPVPETLYVNGACITHKILELPRSTLALATGGACNAFAIHASLAQAFITSGQARRVLSVHSAAMNRIMDPKEPDSAWIGDGAAAVVWGPVSDGKGVLSTVHNTDGTSCNALTLGIPGKRWWQEGAITVDPLDRSHTRTMLMNLVDRARETVTAALTAGKQRPSDVDFYASHQGTAWLTRVSAEHAGLERAKTVITFPNVGNMHSANIPFILAQGERRGLIQDGSVVATFSGGVGETWSSLCIRWGR
ncbi:MAG: 3-oxoacyl-ACP synthase III family protein [Kofleriaceae bacterium]